jgi:hypothetical protein
MPNAKLVTNPVLSIVAIAVLLLLQVPPAVASVKVVVEPTQVAFAPAIFATAVAVITVTVVVTAVAQPALFVTV